jgi:hypothetical protein
MTICDENVEAVREARESLVKKYGGLNGWFRHLQTLDRRRAARRRTDARRATKVSIGTHGDRAGS